MTTLYWDITTHCNARCRYCSALPTRHQQALAFPSLQQVEEALERLATAGVGRLILLGGEPTLRPDLLEIVRLAHARGMSVGIATNALALDGALARGLLAREGVSLNVSLDSPFADENDALRGGGYLARARTNLMRLLALRRAGDSPVAVTIQATLTRLNLGRLEETLERFLAWGVDGVLLERLRGYPWQPPDVRALVPDPGEWILGAVRAARVAARTARSSPSGNGRGGARARILLNYGHARLRRALAERFASDWSRERYCPGGLTVAVLANDGGLHPCRHVAQQPPARDRRGRPHYRQARLCAWDPGAERFLESPYFVDFFNFAHAGTTYAQLALCRACPEYEICEPCPLDVARRGEQVLGECRWLATRGVPDA